MVKQTLFEQIKNIVCGLGIILSIQWGFQLLEYKRIFNEAFRGDKKIRVIKIDFLSGRYGIIKMNEDEYKDIKIFLFNIKKKRVVAD